jgi:hypothetical protein
VSQAFLRGPVVGRRRLLHGRREAVRRETFPQHPHCQVPRIRALRRWQDARTRAAAFASRVIVQAAPTMWPREACACLGSAVLAASSRHSGHARRSRRRLRHVNLEATTRSTTHANGFAAPQGEQTVDGTKKQLAGGRIAPGQRGSRMPDVVGRSPVPGRQLRAVPATADACSKDPAARLSGVDSSPTRRRGPRCPLDQRGNGPSVAAESRP